MKEQRAKGRRQPRLSLSSILKSQLPASYWLLATGYWLLIFAVACNSNAQRQRGIPPEAQATIDTITGDIDAGRYEKIYREAADEWRQTTTLEQSNESFSTLKTRLGNIKGRTYQTAREEQSSSGQLPGHSLVVRYYTTFERGEGTETFTLVERDGRWLLARYFVNSDTLKQ